MRKQIQMKKMLAAGVACASLLAASHAMASATGQERAAMSSKSLAADDQDRLDALGPRQYCHATWNGFLSGTSGLDFDTPAFKDLNVSNAVDSLASAPIEQWNSMKSQGMLNQELGKIVLMGKVRFQQVVIGVDGKKRLQKAEVVDSGQAVAEIEKYAEAARFEQTKQRVIGAQMLLMFHMARCEVDHAALDARRKEVLAYYKAAAERAASIDTVDADDWADRGRSQGSSDRHLDRATDAAVAGREPTGAARAGVLLGHHRGEHLRAGGRSRRRLGQMARRPRVQEVTLGAGRSLGAGKARGPKVRGPGSQARGSFGCFLLSGFAIAAAMAR